MMRTNAKLTDTQLKEARRYTGIIRIVGRMTLEKSEYEGTKGKRFTLRVWFGRSAKAKHYLGYRRVEDRQRGIDSLIDQERQRMATRDAGAKKKADARANFINPYPVGTVFRNSWGYDQTNVDFYEVIGSKGFRLTLRSIGQNATETSFMSGQCQPVRGHYLGEPFNKIIQLMSDGSAYVPIEHGWMAVWDGKPSHWSSYH